MRLTVSLDTPLAVAVIAAAERHRRRPSDELAMLAEAELRRQGLFDDLVTLPPEPVAADRTFEREG